jgi:hypothetical protein
MCALHGSSFGRGRRTFREKVQRTIFFATTQLQRSPFEQTGMPNISSLSFTNSNSVDWEMVIRPEDRRSDNICDVRGARTLEEQKKMIEECDKKTPPPKPKFEDGIDFNGGFSFGPMF